MYIRVTPSTLFKKAEFQGLSQTQQWEKAIANGWRFDMLLNKFFKCNTVLQRV